MAQLNAAAPLSLQKMILQIHPLLPDELSDSDELGKLLSHPHVPPTLFESHKTCYTLVSQDFHVCVL